MAEIEMYKFDETTLQKIRDSKFGTKWPIVYVLTGEKEAYVGETLNAYRRIKEHLKNRERNNLSRVYLIALEKSNKSVTLDLEAFLIKYMSADKKHRLQNGNNGMKIHNYYQKEELESCFEELWKELQSKKIVANNLHRIENSNLFKYSPYKNLTEDQYITVQTILESLSEGIDTDRNSIFMVKGGAGTGKTLIAMYLMKLIIDFQTRNKMTGEYEDEYTIHLNDNLKNLKIALLIPMDSFRATIKKVFRNVEGLSPEMVIGPKDVVKGKYDLLIVDEAHRLQRRKNLTDYPTFDKINMDLGLGHGGTQLDWIRAYSKYQILFYAKRQMVRPADIRKEVFEEIEKEENTSVFELTSQLRCKGGNDYIQYIEDIFSDTPPKKKKSFGDYSFKLYDDVEQMRQDIIKKNEEIGLCRTFAGDDWPWVTKGKSLKDIQSQGLYDIEIDGYRYIWNRVKKDFINSKNAVNEIGCIHTAQGYDLNYAGIIIGNDIKYDKKSKKIIIDKKCYCDRNGKRAVDSDEELKEYIINIYYILLTRGIEGTYVYVCDKNLRKYLKKYIDVELSKK